MRFTRFAAIFTFSILFAAGFLAAQQPPGKTLLDQARAKKAAGDLQAAAEGFERVVTEFAASDRNSTANALLELGEFAELLGKASRAKTYYNRVRSDFADQRAEAASASDRLAAMERGSAPLNKVVIKTPYTEDTYSFAISPDGKMLVYQSTSSDGKRHLWRQPVDASAKPEPIAGTEGVGAGAHPFFSPDGKTIAYFARQKLWQVDVAGGTPKEMAGAPSPNGGAWAGSGVVFSGRGLGSTLEHVQDGRVTPLASAPGLYTFPKFLDDQRFLYFSRDNRGSGRLEVGAMNGPAPAATGFPEAHAGTFGAGHLFYVTAAGSLNALKFDPRQLAATGTSVTVVERVGKEDRLPGQATVSVSASGAIAYREAAVTNRQMVWMDRSGSLIGSAGVADAASPTAPRVSPDGNRILLFRQTGVPLGSVWMMDASNALQLIRDGGLAPIWSPGGDRLIFSTVRLGPAGFSAPLMFEQPVGAIGAPLLAAPGATQPGAGPRGGLVAQRGGLAAAQGRNIGPATGNAFAEDWASNGFILFRTVGIGAAADGGNLFALPPTGADPVPVAQSPAAERNGRFSPDGNWIAYQSDESGRDEIYVQSFPGSATQRQRVSLGGGTSPAWGRKGAELYFLSPDNRLMVADISVNAERRSLESGTPKALFASPLPQGSEFDTRDGDRFLVMLSAEDSPSITVITDWPGGK